MQVVLNNVDSAFLQVLHSFKAIMPNLEIKKVEHSDTRTAQQIKAELDEALSEYKSGELSKFKTLDEAMSHSKATLNNLGAKA